MKFVKSNIFRRYSDLTSTTITQENTKKLVLVDDMPFLHEAAQLKEFSRIISESIRRTKFPLVFIINTDATSSFYLPNEITQNGAVKIIK